MRAIAPLVLSSLASFASAQVTSTWLTTVDGGGAYSSDEFGLAASAPDGDLVVAGARRTNPTSSSPIDMLVARLDEQGTVRWTASRAVVGVREFARGLAVSQNDGAVYVLTSPSVTTQNDLRVTKFDSLGIVNWSVRYSAPIHSANAVGLGLDAADNVYYVASARSSSGSETSDILVESLDSNGALRWSQTIDGGADRGDRAAHVIVSPSGEVTVFGSANAIEFGPSEAILVRISNSGAVSWVRTWIRHSQQTHQFYDGFVDSAGNVFALMLASSGSLPTYSEIVAYDANGNSMWSRTQPDPQRPAEIVADVQGDLILLSHSFDAPMVRVSKLEPNGTPRWETSWDNPPSSFDSPRRLHVDPSGDITVAGMVFTHNPGALDDSDLFVLRLAPTGELLSSQVFLAPGEAIDETSDSLLLPGGAVLLVGSRRDLIGSTEGPADGLVARFDPQAHPYCFGDGVSAPCPCGNVSAIGAQSGCLNSAGLGARLTDLGVASVANDSLVVSIAGEPSDAPTVVIQGTASAGSAAFGDGLRCAGGSVLRMYTRSASAGALQVPGPGDPSVTARAAALGQPISAGSMRVYQSYYRDPNPAFCPAPSGNTWNLSNGLLVRWGA